MYIEGLQLKDCTVGIIIQGQLLEEKQDTEMVNHEDETPAPAFRNVNNVWGIKVL